MSDKSSKMMDRNTPEVRALREALVQQQVDKGKLKGLNMHVTPEQHDRLAAVSLDTGASMAHLARRAIQEWLDRHHPIKK